MTSLLIVVALLALALLAPRYGVDTRDGNDWRYQGDRISSGLRGDRRTPSADLRVLVGVLREVWRGLARAWERQERAWGACWSAYQPWRGDDLPWSRDELRWREVRGEWRLDGRLLPPAPPTDKRFTEPPAWRD